MLGSPDAKKKHEMSEARDTFAQSADAVFGCMAVQDYEQMTAIVEGPWKSIMDTDRQSGSKCFVKNRHQQDGDKHDNHQRRTLLNTGVA
jgi:hypothetical protein